MEVKDMIPVGTKVSPEAREKMMSICERLGITEYDMLQMFYDVAIRTMDDRHNLSYEMEQMIQLFDGMKDWHTSIRLTDKTETMKIVEAFYVLMSEKPTREGTRVVDIQGDHTDMFRTETYNIQQIVERFMFTALPSMYRTLRAIGVDLGTNSIYETLARIVDDYKTNPDAEELRIMFADNDWSENARKPQYNRAKSTRRDPRQLGLSIDNL